MTKVSVSPAELRDELVRMVMTDLRGPSSPDEQLPGTRTPVSEWYLVGMLAPRNTVVDPNRSDRDDPLVPDDDGAAPGQDSRPAKAVLFPSSAGMTFAVDLSCSELEVTASWGRYEKIPNPDPAAEENYSRLWQRHPAGGSARFVLADREIPPFAVDVSQPDVIVRGRCRRTERCWLVTLFLVNGQRPRKRNVDERWLFQIALSVTATGGGSVFVGRRLALPQDVVEADPELRHLDLLYRNKVEFAVGHGIAMHADVDPDDPQRAWRLSIASIPSSEVAKVEAPHPDDAAMHPVEREMLGRITLDMAELSRMDGQTAASALRPLLDAYLHWLDRQRTRIEEDAQIGDHETAEAALAQAEDVAERLRAGIELVDTQPLAAEAFAFANHVMWQQRLHTEVVNARRVDSDLSLADAEKALDTPENHSWRPFQLAFILVNLPSLHEPTHPERRLDTGTADLLFFPTGGGKTEAYLGLTAFTLAVRRLQGVVEGHSGEGGVGVLMRYTLRLLTAQQFQRAATLTCACEVRRRQLVGEGDERWGETPFRIGMWVGGAVTPNRASDAKSNLDTASSGGYSKAASPVTLVACPWCGTTIDPARDAMVHRHLWRTLVHCGDSRGRCPFTPKRSPLEGIPVVTVDEDIYRLVPDMVIATADKFAQLPWQGATSALFGRTYRRCSRHGYRSPALDDWSDRQEADTHKAVDGLGAASTTDCLPRRPPDLIIQDELHLIAGPLGSLFGLYETAVDELASWKVDDATVRPKIVASTATIRNAENQTYQLFCRRLAVFPPQVLDSGDSFFAVERDLEDVPGRLYLGICGMGQRFKSVSTRVFTTVMAASQTLFDKYGDRADPWMTTVGYFNALRELGGMRRMLDDEVTNRLRRVDRRGLALRYLDVTEELTSRISSTDIPKTLDRLGTRFRVERADGNPRPVDVLLATNMISVGVDVPRLGLMICYGQPKTTAEYIQATSRVGRTDEGPGLVLTLYNWSRPRDLSHYEAFEYYHQTYYRQVEALSVTPFARRALDRGVTALMVALARQRNPNWNPNRAAQIVPVGTADFDDVDATLVHRAELVAGAKAGPLVGDLVTSRRDKWSKRQDAVGVTLVYARGRGDEVDLLRTPESGPWADVTVSHSLREVEPASNLILRRDDPSDDSAAMFPPPPTDDRPEEADDVGAFSEDADIEDQDVDPEVRPGA